MLMVLWELLDLIECENLFFRNDVLLFMTRLVGEISVLSFLFFIFFQGNLPASDAGGN